MVTACHLSPPPLNVISSHRDKPRTLRNERCVLRLQSMVDDHEASHYKIDGGDVLHLVLMLRGGAH